MWCCPSNNTKEKYIFKTKHSVSCDSLYSKNDENIIVAVDDWQQISVEANDLLNSKSYYYKSECVNSLVELYNQKSRSFPLVVDKIYTIIKNEKKILINLLNLV